MKDLIDFAYLQKGKNFYSNVRHSHGKSYEFVLVCAGSGSFAVRDRIFPIRPACLYCIDGLETHCSAPDDPNAYERRILVLKADFVDKLVALSDCEQAVKQLFKRGGECIQLTNTDAEKLAGLFSAVAQAIEKHDSFAKSQIAVAVLSLLACACRQATQAPEPADKRVGDVLAYINRNLAYEIRLDDVCKEVYMSKYHLCRIFKKEIGMSVFNYVLSLRLSRAKKDLIFSDKSVSRIAADAGFADFSYFSKIFKSYEGMTPTQFRAQHEQE